MNKNNNICNNCGKLGHLFHQCKLPITSHGIIAYKYNIELNKDINNSNITQISNIDDTTTRKNNIYLLMIRRKDSFGYIDFIRGKYSPNNKVHLKIIIDEMTNDEKYRLLTYSFEKLWTDMWGNSPNKNNNYKNEENLSKKKFEQIREKNLINGGLSLLEELILSSETCWNETEWEFPKGRRNQREKDIECALREFEEETGISKYSLQIIENLLPFEEIFIGSNYKSYKHKYFLAKFENSYYNCDFMENFQKTEVSKMEWKTIDDCLNSIRPYNLEKKELILKINNVIQKYRLY